MELPRPEPHLHGPLGSSDETASAQLAKDADGPQPASFRQDQSRNQSQVRTEALGAAQTTHSTDAVQQEAKTQLNLFIPCINSLIIHLRQQKKKKKRERNPTAYRYVVLRVYIQWQMKNTRQIQVSILVQRAAARWRNLTKLNSIQLIKMCSLV